MKVTRRVPGRRRTAGRLGPSLVLGLYLIFVLLFALPPSAGGGSLNAANLEKSWEYTREDSEATFWKLAWSPDGEMVAATFFDNTCLVLNASDGSLRKELKFTQEGGGSRCDGFAPNGSRPLRACAFSPDGQYLALAGDDMVIHILNTTSWETVREFRGHRGSILCLDFSPDSRYLASGSGTDKVIPQNQGENQTKIWDLETGLLKKTLKGHRDGVLAVEWSHHGNRLVTVSDDRSIRVWAFPNGTELVNMSGHTSGVLDLDWSPDDERLITGSRDYKIKVWNSSSGEQLASWGDNNCVRSVDFHPTEELAATSGVDLTLKIRDAGTGSSLRVIKDGVSQHAMVMCSKWSPDGSMLVSGLGKSHTVIMYRFGSGGGGEEDEGNVALRSTVILAVISVVFLAALYYPAYQDIRGRRR